MSASKTLEYFPEIDPFQSGLLKVSDIHQIYYEQSGKPDGKPVVFVHGGPGVGTSPQDRRFFDPTVYRIILFDQRGAGKSQPQAEIKENTTWDLVEDMEKLRRHLGISKWLVFGGSWGSTLALVYAQTHTDKIKALVLWGILTLRRRELLWYYQDGARFIFPDKWDDFVAPIPEVERGDLIRAYNKHLTSDDEKTRLKAANAYSTWGMCISRPLLNENLIKHTESDAWSLSFARIGSHYSVNGGFFYSDTQLLDNVDKIRHIPCTIVQGRYDVVCPMETAWLLHKKWPEADFHIVQDAGHSKKESGIISFLMETVKKYQDL